MFRIQAIAAALIGALSAAAAHADVYRWTDPQGHVMYSDTWVPGSVLIKITTPREAAPSPPPVQADQQKLATSDAGNAQQQATEQTVKQDMAAAKAEQCKKASDAYQKAIQSRRIYKDGKNGEREYLSDPDADAYRAKLLTERTQLCGK